MQDSAFMDALTTASPKIQRAVDQLRYGIARSLGIDLKNFQVILVLVSEHLLAFEYESGIYLNCMPLIGASDRDMKNSIFFSLLHELVHRAHINHDSSFADEYGKLVYHCSACLN